MAVISHDPFAREELHRETHATTAGCAWCGSKRKNGKLFSYFYVRDDATRAHLRRDDKLYCSVGCFRDYHS